MINENQLINELKQSGMIADNDYGNAMVDLINRQPRIGEWTPCSVQLPEYVGNFLVCCESGRVYIARYGYNTTYEYKCFWVGHVEVENIIAWQPLPEPYKEDN